MANATLPPFSAQGGWVPSGGPDRGRDILLWENNTLPALTINNLSQAKTPVKPEEVINTSDK